MARTSYGPRQAAAWPVVRNRPTMPRIVRVGRPANDNYRRPGLLIRLCFAGLGGVLLALALINWRVI